MTGNKKVIEIHTYGDGILARKAEPFTEVTPEDRELVERMAESMYENNGIGLAANQVGVLKQIVLVDVDQLAPEAGGKGKRNTRILVNPTIVAESDEDMSYNEGCLSLPDISADVYRPVAIELTYCDLDMKEHKIQCDGLLARVIQHEVDHLNGILFVDRLGFMKRSMLAGKLNRLKKQTLEHLKKK
jgi:peptide deformylase